MDTHDETRTQCLALVASLPDRYQDVLRLRLVYRRSVPETAEIVHTSPIDVLVTQHAALNMLRQRLKGRAPRRDHRDHQDICVTDAQQTPERRERCHSADESAIGKGSTT